MSFAPRSKINLGVIGCGHWGPNHVRVFNELDRSRVLACADLNADRLARLRSRHPLVATTTDYREILDNPGIHAVVISTPTATHARLAKEALDAGKHVLVEKPLCMTNVEANEIGQMAERARRVLMVGHVFLFNHGIIRLRELAQAGALGRLRYIDAVRTNLGPVRGDVNALLDLGTHDISIFNYLLGSTPLEVSATGSRISQSEQEDVCFATLRYPGGTLAHLHVSWLNPRKVRTLTVVGEAKMAHWDDVDPVDTLRIYDKGFREPPSYNSFGEFQYLLHSGDVHIPTVSRTEPLVNQANTFLDCVIDGAACRSGVQEGAAVVSVLEAAVKSLRGGGAMCPVRSIALDEPRMMEKALVAPLKSATERRERVTV